MKRLVIAISEGWTSSQFGLNEFSGRVNISGEDAEYLIHRHPLVKIKDGCILQTNFDILIDNVMSGGSNPMFELLPKHRHFYNRRESKSITRFKINNAGIGEDGFIPINCWKNNDNILSKNSGQFGNNFSGVVILKEEFGARGRGQILFDTEQVSPGNVMRVIDNIWNKLIPGPDKVTIADDSDDAKILDLLHKELPNARLGYDKKEGVRESIEVLRQGNLYLEEFIPDIQAEYRILFSPGVAYIFQRSIDLVDDYPQACGSTGGMKASLTGSAMAKVSKEFSGALRLLNKAGIQYGSADLFITKKGWGLFEYSSQYGAEGVAPIYSADVQENLVKHVIQCYLEGEGNDG